MHPELCHKPSQLPTVSGRLATPKQEVPLIVENLAPSTKMLVIKDHILKAPPSDKLVIASHQVEFLKFMNHFLGKLGIGSVIYHGKMSPKQKDEVVQRFKSQPEIRCMLLSITAGGQGLNLTGANHMIICDPAWSPATEKHCMGRINRIGQKKAVYGIRLVATNTVEEILVKEYQFEKQRITDGVMSGATQSTTERQELDPGRMRSLLGIKSRKRSRRKPRCGKDRGSGY